MNAPAVHAFAGPAGKPPLAAFGLVGVLALGLLATAAVSAGGGFVAGYKIGYGDGWNAKPDPVPSIVPLPDYKPLPPITTDLSDPEAKREPD